MTLLSASTSLSTLLSCSIDRLRRLRRREDAVPLRDVDVGDALLLERGHVRHERRALGAGNAHRLQLAGLDVRHGREEAGKHHLRLAADGVGDGRRGALVGHVQHAGARRELEHLGGEVRRRAVAGRGVAGLVRRGLEHRHDFLRVAGLDGRIEHHQRCRRSDHADRLEVLDRVVAKLLQRRVHRMRRDVAQHERVAVGRARASRIRWRWRRWRRPCCRR